MSAMVSPSTRMMRSAGPVIEWIIATAGIFLSWGTIWGQVFPRSKATVT